MKALLLFLVLLGGCSISLPVRGKIDGTPPVDLIGEATGYLGGSGDLHMTGSDGRDCTGKFQYAPSGKSGTGTFTCQEGSSGTFVFNSTGNQGVGFGRTSRGERVRFVFGASSAYDPSM